MPDRTPPDREPIGLQPAIPPPAPADLFDGTPSYPPLPSVDEAPRRRRAVRRPPAADVDLHVPYVHQLWDTPRGFNGHWACGPSCAAMVLAYYGLLTPHPLELERPEPHVSHYGWYVGRAFTHGDVTFDATAATPDGEAAGIYGSVVDRIGSGWGAHFHSPTGRGLGPVFGRFLPAVGNTVRCVTGPKGPGTIFMERAPTEAAMVESLEAGHPLIVSGRFRFGGRTVDHLIVVRGHYLDPTSGTRHWLVNDPYGFETTGQGFDGERVAYTFDEIAPKWLARFEGPHTGTAEAETGHVPVRLFDPDTNEPVGEGTLIAGTDKVYVKRWDR